jgi:tetratricopeptide (TPR) repeat protein
MLLKDIPKRTDAKACYEEAIRIREEVVRDAPKEPNHRAKLASTRGSFAGLLNALGEPGESRRAFTQAADELDKLLAEFPNVIEYRADIARLRHNFGRLLAGQGRATEAVAELRRSVATFAKLAADVPTVPEYRSAGATSQQHLGDELNGLGKTSEARAAYEEALRLWEGLLKEFPDEDEHRLGLATTCNNFGAAVAEAEGRPADAQKLFARGVQALTPLPADDPQAAFVLRNCHANRALALDRIGRSGDAVPHWEGAIALSPPAERADLRAKLALSLADIGNLTRAVAELDDLRMLNTWTAQDWYHFSWVYALASAKLPDRKAEYGGVSVELVRKAIAAGFRDVADLKRNRFLAPVRQREDFKQVVAELEKKLAPKREVLPPPRADISPADR